MMRSKKNTQEVSRGSGEAERLKNVRGVDSKQRRTDGSVVEKEAISRGAQKANIERKSKSRSKNKRFWETEKAILEAFYGVEGEQKVGDLAENAKIARSTFYNHHRNFYQIIPDLERKTLGDYEREMEAALRRNYQIRTLLHQMLMFIRKNRREFRMIVDRGDERTLEAMIDELLPKIVEAYNIPRGSEEILRVYQKEIAAIVETWILGEFRPKEMEILGDMMYMTSTARRRLMVLMH